MNDHVHNTDKRTFHFEWSEQMPVSLSVVYAISEVVDGDPSDATPLYDVIDPDSLDQLFAPGTSGSRGIESLSFVYAGHRVVVDGDGEIRITGAEN